MYCEVTSEKYFDDLTKHAKVYREYADSLCQSRISEKTVEIQEKYASEFLLKKHLQSKHLLTRTIASFLFFIFAGIFCFWLYHCHVNRQKRVLYSLIDLKELELQRVFSDLNKLESDFDKESVDRKKLERELSKLIQRCINTEHALLELRGTFNKLNADYAKETINKSALHGGQLSHRIDTLINSGYTFVLKTSDFSDIINFYQIIDESFMKELKKRIVHLTTMEFVICILFRKNLSHKQVCALLGSSSETLSRAKLRIKCKMLVRKKLPLEEIIINI